MCDLKSASSLMILQNLSEPYTSWNVLQSGVGAARMTFGSRKSHFAPALKFAEEFIFGASQEC
jgi:hypothetical protein